MPLHPQAQQFLESLAEQNAPGWSEYEPAEAREVFSGWTHLFGDGPDIHQVEDVTVCDGIAARVYRPVDHSSLPVMMYFHGGGWVLGDIESHDALCRRLSLEAQCAVISVHYRRAPEAKYPAAIDDCYAATDHISRHAADFGIDATRLVVVGDSAGGNLAAAVSLKARDCCGPAICGQILIYPIAGHDFETQSYSDYAEGFGLTRDSMMWFWQQYLGSADADSLAAPLLAESLKDLPPTHMILAEYDVLRSEGENYGRRLIEDGVPATIRQFDGMLHGFVQFNAVFDAGRDAISDAAAVFQRFIV